MTTTDSSSAPARTDAPGVRALLWLTVATAVGTALLAIGHTGVSVPLVSALGPGGTDPVWPAAIAFTVATALFAVVAIGLLRGRAWSWPLATLANGLVLVSGIGQFRGAASAIGMALAAVSLVLLLTPGVRRALLGSR